MTFFLGFYNNNTIFIPTVIAILQHLIKNVHIDYEKKHKKYLF